MLHTSSFSHSNKIYLESVISAQALKIKQRLLEEHNKKPFLTESEVTAMTSFQDSDSWAGKVARESGWRSKALHGEAGGVDVAEVEPQMAAIRAKIKQFDPNYVYNMDETGLFFKVLPNRSYVKQEDVKTVRGTKLMKAKDRVTLYVTTNATGTDKVPLSLIGKSKNPRCFRNKTLKLKYYNQAKAWSDSKVFKKWWEAFRLYIRSRTNRKCLLIMDNCGPHGTELVDPGGQIEVIFLPPNVTSVYQPMDAGVIAMLKKNYRYRLLMRMFDIFEERQDRREAAKAAKMAAGTMGLNEGYAPHVFDVIEILYEVWNEIPASKIKKCWVKSTLVSFDPPPQPPPAAANASAEEAINVEAGEDDIVEVLDNEATEDTTEVVDEEMGNGVGEEDGEMEASSDAKDVFDRISSFAKSNTLKPNASGNTNEFDDAIWEMMLAVDECDENDSDNIEAMMNGWVATEDTEFCKELLVDEVSGSLELDVLCQLKEAPGAEEDDDEEDEETEIVTQPKPATSETISDLAARLKTLSVEIGALGEGFSSASMHVSDSEELLRLAFRKMNMNKIAKKQDSGRQTHMGGFMQEK